MNSTGHNFFKTKKANNLYKSADVKNSYNDLPRGRTSMSPNRNSGLSDIMKKNRKSKLPLVNGVNNPYKLMDTDKLNEELIQYKNEINKKNKEFNYLKISYNKLDEDNKKNIRIIEEIILESGRNQRNSQLINMNQEELENEIKNIFSISNPSEKMLNKLKEVNSIINFFNFFCNLSIELF